MKKSDIFKQTVAVCALGLLSILYMHSQVDQQKHLAITESILLYKESDIRLNQRVIQYQMDYHKNFDSISRSQTDLLDLRSKLKSNLQLYSASDKSLKNLLDELELMEYNKLRLVSNYKKQAAINKFTKQYLPHAIQDAKQSIEDSVVISTNDRNIVNFMLESLNLSVTRYVAGYDNNVEHISDMARLLHDTAFGLETETENKFELLTQYVNSVIFTSNQLVFTIGYIQNIGLGKIVKLLENRYSLLLDRQSRQEDIFKNLLLVTSVLLLIYLGITRFQLKKTSTSLSDTLSTLEFHKRALDSHAIVSVTDVKGNIIYVNDQFCEISQFCREELIGQTHRIVKSDVHDANFYRNMWKSIANGRIWQGQICNIAKDGSYYWVETTLMPRLNKIGKPYEYIGLRTDVTAQKVAEQEIKTLARFPMENPEPVLRISNTGEILFYNPAAQLFLDHWGITSNKKMSSQWIQRIGQILISGNAQEVEINIDDHCWALSITPVEEPSYVNIYCRDVTEKRQVEESLKYQANYDRLTGLTNRYSFEKELNSVLVSAQLQIENYILLYIDLDQFKIVNDTCGHIAGDELLKQISNTMLNQIRDEDTLARLGGDEFGIIIVNCNLEFGNNIASKILDSIRQYRFLWQDKQFEIGASIGLVEITSNSESAISVLGHADIACYAAKDAGRNRISVYSAQNSESAQRHSEIQWASYIPTALANDRFQLMVQTIAPLRNIDRDTLHYEVLLRMLGEDGRLIPPGVFIPAAERFNLMQAIDQWVVRHTFEFLHDYSQTCAPGEIPVLAINLSGGSMGNQDLLTYVCAQFELERVIPKKICFEITETAAIANLTKALSFIKTLKKYGCKFALDDFGSGLSSFSYLKSLPIDYLKIDGVFVKDIVNDPIDASMVEAINRVGHIMGIQTIAEFVESQPIMDMLTNIGVDYAQGYHIDKPSPLREKFHVIQKTRLTKTG